MQQHVELICRRRNLACPRLRPFAAARPERTQKPNSFTREDEGARSLPSGGSHGASHGPLGSTVSCHSSPPVWRGRRQPRKCFPEGDENGHRRTRGRSGALAPPRPAMVDLSRHATASRDANSMSLSGPASSSSSWFRLHFPGYHMSDKGDVQPSSRGNNPRWGV